MLDPLNIFDKVPLTAILISWVIHIPLGFCFGLFNHNTPPMSNDLNQGTVSFLLQLQQDLHTVQFTYCDPVPSMPGTAHVTTEC